MASEGRSNCGLSINKSNLKYPGIGPNAFTFDVDEGTGPTPGMISVSLTGTDVDLSKLAVPGVCEIVNLDPTNYVTYGVYEPSTGTFYPLGEVLAGEKWVVRLSRQLGEEWAGTVTGTGTNAVNNTLRFKANGAACNVIVNAFGK